MQVEFVTRISERPWGSKCQTFSEIIHWIMSPICSGIRLCPLHGAWLLVDIFSLTKHMGLLSLNLIKLHTCQGHALGHGSSVICTR